MNKQPQVESSKTPGDRPSNCCIQVCIPTYEECEFSFEYKPEVIFTPPKENIEWRLNEGDKAAWFSATCHCHWRGLEAKISLGCCSYTSFEDFEGMSQSAGKLRKDTYLILIKMIRRLAMTGSEELDDIASPNSRGEHRKKDSNKAVTGLTIHHTRSIEDQAAIGTTYAAIATNPDMVAQAMTEAYHMQIIFDPWEGHNN